MHLKKVNDEVVPSDPTATVQTSLSVAPHIGQVTRTTGKVLSFDSSPPTTATLFSPEIKLRFLVFY